MSAPRCPDEDELIRFVDRDLSPEQLERVERHIEGCAGCRALRDELRSLIRDLAAPVASAPLAVDEHLAAVMRRLDAPLPEAAPIWRRARVWTAGLVLAAAALLLFQWHARTRQRRAQELLAQVSVQLFVQDGPGAPFVARTRVPAGGAVSANVSNTSDRPVYVLVLALDGEGERLWLAPRGSAPERETTPPNPALTLVPKAESERLLGQLGHKLERLASAAVRVDPAPGVRPLGYSVSLRALAPGHVRVFTLISSRARMAGEIDLLPATQLTRAGLQRQFPEAQVGELALEITP